MARHVNLMPEGFHEPKQVDYQKKITRNGAILLIVVVIYFGLFLLIEGLNFNISQNEQVISRKEEEIESAKLVSETLNLNDLVEFKQVVDNHLTWSVFFPELERLTLPQVYFRSMSAHSSDTGQAEVVLSGNAPNFQDLAGQITALRSSPIFAEVSFKTQGLSKAGGVDFSVEIELTAQALLFNA